MEPTTASHKGGHDMRIHDLSGVKASNVSINDHKVGIVANRKLSPTIVDVCCHMR
jgi:hypothetical protein